MQLPHPSEEEVQDAIRNLVNLTVSKIWKTSDEKEPVFIVKPQEPIGRAITAICDINNAVKNLSDHKNQYVVYDNYKKTFLISEKNIFLRGI